MFSFIASAQKSRRMLIASGDGKVKRHLNSEEDTDIIQKKLDDLGLWSNTNGMKIHNTKFKVTHLGNIIIYL